DQQRRLMAEARILAKLNHPHVVRVFDFEQDAHFPYLVLEYVNGPSLEQLIVQSGRVQPARVVHIMRQLADALAATHRLGIVHRDIKPANVLLTRDGDVKLADLGLATVRGPAHAADAGPLPASARVGRRLATHPADRPAASAARLPPPVLGGRLKPPAPPDAPGDGRSSWGRAARRWLRRPDGR